MLKYEIVQELDHQVSAPKLLGNLCQLFCGADKTCLQAPAADAAAAAAAQLPPCSQLSVHVYPKFICLFNILTCFHTNV